MPFAIGREPHCRKPFIQTDLENLKDRSDLARILARVNRLALPHFGVGKKRHVLRTQCGQADAFGQRTFRRTAKACSGLLKY